MKYLACLFGLWVLLLGAYVIAGSFHAEFSGHDEASYIVSGVMVREYLGGALWTGESPLAFAQQYYAHYPKVAIGHWPPGYFLVQGVWLLFTGVSRPALLALSALLSATLASITVLLCRREGLRWSMAVMAGVVAALLPLGLDSLIEIGSDVITGIAILVATLCCQHWLEKQTTRNGVLFGVAAAVAILCKGSAFLLLLVPPLALLFTRKPISWLWKTATWMPILLAVLLVLPWFYYSQELLQVGVVPGPAKSLIDEVLPREAQRRMVIAVPYSAGINTILLLRLGGLGLMLLVILSLRTHWYRGSAAFAVLPLATWVFLSVLSPHTDARLMIHLVPVLVFAAAVAANALVPRMQELVLLAALITAHWGSSFQRKSAVGFVPAVAWIRQQQDVAAESILISSNSNGEGALISEFAVHEPAPRRTIVRASKVLESSTWMGDDLRLLVHSASDVTNTLDRNSVSLVVVHERATEPPARYKASLDEALGSWSLVRQHGDVRIYRRTP